mgnify:FL=1
MAAESTWARRIVDSRGGHFRIETGSPRVGRDGPEPTKIYSSNDNGEVFLIAHGHGSGLGRIACDKSIEINAGDKNDPNSIDIRVCAATGDITISAPRGRIRMQAKDFMFSADRDIDFNAGRNINMHPGVGRFYVKANTAQVQAKRGNMVPESYGAKVTKNSFIPDSTLAKIFDPKSQNTKPGAAPGGFDGVAGGALKGYGFSLEDLGISEQTGAVDAVENAIKEASSKLINPLQKASNLLSGKLGDSLGDVLKGAGAGDLVNQVTGGIDDPVGSALGLSGIDKIPGSTTIASAASNYLGGQLPGVGGAMDTIKGIGNKVLTGNIETLTASAASALGVTPGGNSLTGLTKMIGTGSVGKGAAATIGNFSSDKLAALAGDTIPTHPDVPVEQTIKGVANSTAMYMDQLKQDFLTASNTPNILKKMDDAIKDVDLEKRLLEGEEIIGDLKNVAKKFKLP